MDEKISYMSSSSMFYASMSQDGIFDLLAGKDMAQDSPKVAVAYLKRYLAANFSICKLACDVIFKFAETEDNRAQMNSLKVVLVLLKCIQKVYTTDSELTQKAFRALGALLVDNSTKDLFNKKHGIDIMKDSLLHFATTEKGITTELMDMIQILAKYDSSLQRFVEQGMIPILFSVYDYYADKDEDVVNTFMITIATIATASSYGRNAMIGAGGVQILVDALKAYHNKNERIVKTGLISLRSLATANSALNEIVLFDGLPTLQAITEETKESNPRIAQNSLCLIALVAKSQFIPLDFQENAKELALTLLKHNLDDPFPSIYSPTIIQYSLAIILSLLLKDSNHGTLLTERDYTQLFITVLDRFIEMDFDSQPTIPSIIRLALGIIAFLAKMEKGSEMLIECDGVNVLLDISEKTLNKETKEPALDIVQNATASLTFLTQKNSFLVMCKAQQTHCRLLVLASRLLLFVEEPPSKVSTSIAFTILENIAAMFMFLSSSVRTNASDPFTQTQDDLIVLLTITSGIVEPLASSPGSDESETDEERPEPKFGYTQESETKRSTLISLLLASCDHIAKFPSASVVVQRCSEIVSQLCIIWKDYQTAKQSKQENEFTVNIPFEELEKEHDKESNAILSKFSILMLAEDIFPTITHTIEQFMATSQPSLSLTRTLTSVVTVLCNLTAHRNVVTSLHAKCEKTIEMLVGVEHMVQEMHDDFDDDSSNASHDDLEELLKAIEGANADHLEFGDGLYKELKQNSTLTSTVPSGFSLNQTAMATANLAAADSQATKMGELLSSRVWDCLLSIMSADSSLSGQFLNTFITHSGINILSTRLKAQTMLLSSHQAKFKATVSGEQRQKYNPQLTSRLCCVASYVCSMASSAPIFAASGGTMLLVTVMHHALRQTELIAQKEKAEAEKTKKKKKELSSKKAEELEKTKQKRKEKQHFNKQVIRNSLTALLHLVQHSNQSTVELLPPFAPNASSSSSVHTAASLVGNKQTPVRLLLRVCLNFISTDPEISMIASECLSTLCSYTAFTSFVPFDSEQYSPSHGDVASQISMPSSLVPYYETVSFRSLGTQPAQVPFPQMTTASQASVRSEGTQPMFPIGAESVLAMTEGGTRSIVSLFVFSFTKLKEEWNNPNTHSFDNMSARSNGEQQPRSAFAKLSVTLMRIIVCISHYALFISKLIASSQDEKKDANEPKGDRMERESLLTDAAKMEWDADLPNYDQFGEIDTTMSGHSDISGELPGSTVSSLSLPSSSTKNIRHIDKHQLAGDPKLTSFITAVFSAEFIQPISNTLLAVADRARKSTRINDVKTSYFDDDLNQLMFCAENYVWNAMFFNEKNEKRFGREDSGMVKSLLDVLGVLVQNTVFDDPEPKEDDDYHTNLSQTPKESEPSISEEIKPADVSDTTSEPKTEKVERTDEQVSVRSAKSQRSTLSQQKRASRATSRGPSRNPSRSPSRTPSRSQTRRSSAAQQIDLAGSFMISDRDIHTKRMTLMILVQIANHPHSHIAFNKTTGMGITPARVLSAVLNNTLLQMRMDRRVSSLQSGRIRERFETESLTLCVSLLNKLTMNTTPISKQFLAQAKGSRLDEVVVALILNGKERNERKDISITIPPQLTSSLITLLASLANNAQIAQNLITSYLKSLMPILESMSSSTTGSIHSNDFELLARRSISSTNPTDTQLARLSLSQRIVGLFANLATDDTRRKQLSDNGALDLINRLLNSSLRGFEPVSYGNVSTTGTIYTRRSTQRGGNPASTPGSVLPTPSITRHSSFASRTRGKEQTTIMITTASSLCVPTLQLIHDCVVAANNICCSTRALKKAHKLNMAESIMHVLRSSNDGTLPFDAVEVSTSSLQMELICVDCLCVCSQLREIEYDIIRSNGIPLLLSLINIQTQKYKAFFDPTASSDVKLTPTSGNMSEMLQRFVLRLATLLTSIGHDLRLTRVDMVKEGGVQTCTDAINILTPNRQNPKLHQMLETLIKLMNPDYVTYMEQHASSIKEKSPQESLHSSRLNQTLASNRSAAVSITQGSKR
ncbi:hypothetical protein BLNAU_11189 [Blattamonas nauphoetae]|uniref:HECT-type E3 ubiquitin transferase n=1 Tax=Blattamonas nauphoetae TaxID=2049346 RepID=A0ABQ9XQA9_9EUKA|nr:hypothetical protein BLNAU_11189 [Blattamonas nauphoetae]